MYFTLRKTITFTLCALLVISVMGCNQQSKLNSSSTNRNQAGDLSQTDPTKVPSDLQVEEVREATLMATGDIMMHLPQITSGFDPVTDSYDFRSFFTEVKPIFAEADWLIGNLETPLGGRDTRYSGYPQFNAPVELADALQDAGFHLVSTANNHGLDRREKGVLATIENVRKRGIIPVGTASTSEEALEIPVVERNGIQLAFLAYTYGTNGIPIPEGKHYLINLIDPERIADDIHRAKALGVDLVVVSLHFGLEYQLKPNEDQKQLAHQLFREGADIILGSHPHVLQPYEIIETEQADGTMKRGVVIYSMGNFISNQDRSRTNKPTDIGVIFQVKLRKVLPDGIAEIDEVSVIPTYVHRQDKGKGKYAYRVIPLQKTLEAHSDPLFTDKDYTKLESYYAYAQEHLESFTTAVNKPSK